MSDGLTDVVGHLEALAPMVIVRPKSGDDVEIDPADVVSVRELSHRPVRNSEIRALEHAAALAWPGTEQHWHDGWLLRAGSGHTSRANSAVPLLFSSSTEVLSEIVSWYAERGLAPWLALPERLLPIKAPGVKPTRVLVRDLSPAPSVPGVALAEVPDEQWLRVYARDVPPDILTAVLDGGPHGLLGVAELGRRTGRDPRVCSGARREPAGVAALRIAGLPAAPPSPLRARR